MNVLGDADIQSVGGSGGSTNIQNVNRHDFVYSLFFWWRSDFRFWASVNKAVVTVLIEVFADIHCHFSSVTISAELLNLRVDIAYFYKKFLDLFPEFLYPP